jgi:hypothetical protein
MNPDILLRLIHDLYSQLLAAQQRIQELEKERSADASSGRP